MSTSQMTIAVAAYLILVAAMSLVTFAAYGWDKRRAAVAGRRIPERTLHLMAFFGGWPGAMLGQRTFRHKTKKLSFLVVFWFVVLLHLAIVSTIAYRHLASTSDASTAREATDVRG